MRDKYDFSPEELRKGIRGRFAARYKEGVKPIPISNKPLAAGEANPEPDTLAVLEKLSGTADAPTDLAAEHDHYLYGTPKRADTA